MAGPLEGFRILDLTSVILGPYATQILGDLGADIIKVESPAGDTSRYVNAGRSRGMSGTALNIHRSKRSIVLDLKQDEGRAALLKLAEGADALVHNIRPQAMARLGLAYDNLKAARADIVYCACTGFGGDGPNSGRPAYDDMIQGASGIADLTGRMQGEPQYFPGTICDKITGLTAVYAVVAALLARERSGEGQYVEVPMFETMVSFNMVEHICDSIFQPPLEPFGYKRMLTANRRPYRTADGHACLMPYTDRHWARFFELAGKPELKDDPRFADFRSRTDNVDALYGLVAEAALTRTTAEWLAVCEEAQIPAGPVMSLDDASADPHLAATGFLKTRTHPSEGDYTSVGIPTRFTATPAEVVRDAPRLGEHSAEILKEAGYSNDEIAALERDGVTAFGRG